MSRAAAPWRAGARGPRRARLALGLALPCAALALSLAPDARADVRRIEAVGAVPVRPDDRSDPRQRAIAAGLREAVERVASELLIDADYPAEEQPDLDALLGDDMVPYTARYRVIEDRGQGPALFLKEDGAAEEYVVVLAVEVEVERVRERLSRLGAGLLPPPGSDAERRVVQLEVRGARVYPAFADLREVLVERVGAAQALPVGFERHRAMLAVTTELSADRLVEQLAREAPPHMQVVSLGTQRAFLRVQVRWTPPPPPEEEALPAVESGRPRWGPRRARR